MTIFILYLCLEGVYQIGRKKLLLGCFLIGFGISVKILPLVLIPWFIYRRQFKAALYSSAFTVIVLFLPAIYIGYEQQLFLLHERWKLIDPINNEHVLDTAERSFHSITTLLSVLLVENSAPTDQFVLDIKRNIADISLETLKTIILCVRLLFVGLTLLFIRSLPFRRSTNNLQTFYELSYILLIVPLIFPHQQHYAFFFSFPAITYLVYFHLGTTFDPASKAGKSRKAGIIAIAVIIYFLLNNHFILGEFRKIYDHFKTLTYGILFLIPLLAMARPEQIVPSTDPKTNII